MIFALFVPFRAIQFVDAVQIPVLHRFMDILADVADPSALTPAQEEILKSDAWLDTKTAIHCLLGNKYITDCTRRICLFILRFMGKTLSDPLVQALSENSHARPHITRETRDEIIPSLEEFLLTHKISLLNVSKTWQLYGPGGHLHADRQATLRKLSVYSSQVYQRKSVQPIAVSGPLDAKQFLDQLKDIDAEFAPFIRYSQEQVKPVIEEQALFACSKFCEEDFNFSRALLPLNTICQTRSNFGTK